MAKKRKKSGLTRLTAFHAVMAVFVLLAAAGLARVSLSAKCAEAAVDAGQLRSDIRAELQESDQLEVAKHSLSNPSRLDNIAATSMGMTTPQDVCYLALPGGPVQEVACEETATLAASPDAPAAAVEAGLSPILRTVMDMAAGEAQVLLVGDVGLASER